MTVAVRTLARLYPPWVVCVLAIVVQTAVASPCLAQVIEIGPDGGTVTYEGPARFTLEGVESLVLSKANTVGQASPDEVSRLIHQAAERQQLSPDLVTEIARRESSFRQSAVSPRDAVGVMQLTAGTARQLGVDRYDLSQNIHGGTAYLRQMLDRYNGDVQLALAAYNAGPGAVDRFRGVPPFRETQAYVGSIMGRLAVKSSFIPSISGK